jgi:hypothetical protein
MIADPRYNADEVRVVVTTGAKAAIQYANIYPLLNQIQTIDIDEIIPPFSNKT